LNGVGPFVLLDPLGLALAGVVSTAAAAGTDFLKHFWHKFTDKSELKVTRFVNIGFFGAT
jgi:hypothetical protein